MALNDRQNVTQMFVSAATSTAAEKTLRVLKSASNNQLMKQHRQPMKATTVMKEELQLPFLPTNLYKSSLLMLSVHLLLSLSE